MKKKSKFVSVMAIVLLGVALINVLAQNCFGDFILYNNEQLIVNQYHLTGKLYDTSSTSIVSGGSVHLVLAYDSTSVSISGGSIGAQISAFESSSVNISAGSVPILDALYYSSVNISGGSVDKLTAEHSSSVNISGGSLVRLEACNSSSVTFYGKNFDINGGLTLDGNRLLGTGILSGEWMDGTLWSTDISGNSSDATVRIIPEPATILLLGLGAVMLRRKR